MIKKSDIPKTEREEKRETFIRYANTPDAIFDCIQNYEMALELYKKNSEQLNPVDFLLTMTEITGNLAKIVSVRRKGE